MEKEGGGGSGARGEDDRRRQLEQGKDEVREMAASGPRLLTGRHAEAQLTSRGTQRGGRHDHGVGTRSEETH
jgi:hypothetical protein